MFNYILYYYLKFSSVELAFLALRLAEYPYIFWKYETKWLRFFLLSYICHTSVLDTYIVYVKYFNFCLSSGKKCETCGQ